MKNKQVICSLTLVLLTVFAPYSNAESTSNDFGRSDDVRPALTAKDIRDRLEISGEIFITDANGNLKSQLEESRLWKFGSKGDIESNWSHTSAQSEDIAFRQRWHLNDDGSIEILLQQFESMKRKQNSRDLIIGKLIREEKITLKNFNAITWVAKESRNEKTVILLTPKLAEKPELLEVTGLPVTLTDLVIYDNKGRLWAQAGSLEGTYISIKTHLGQIALSFSPFKGAKEIGTVNGSQITLKGSNDLRIEVRSKAAIFTGTKPAKVYGILDTAKRSEAFNSVYSSASSTESNFLEHL